MNIFPVIHYLSDEQATSNVSLAQKYNCKGVFLIDMSGDRKQETLNIAVSLSKKYPNLDVGVNHLGFSALKALQLNTSSQLSMTWTDKCLTHTNHSADFEEKHSIASILNAEREHSLFAAVAFKYQPLEPQPGLAALRALNLGYIPTTSGTATGQSISLEKLQEIRSVIGESARLAVASGITPSNIHEFKNLITDALVATSITSTGSELIIESELEKISSKCQLLN